MRHEHLEQALVLTAPKMFHRPHRLAIDEAVVAHRRCHHFPWTSQAHNNTWPLRQERQPCFERPAEPRILPRRRRGVGKSAHLLRVRSGRRDYILAARRREALVQPYVTQDAVVELDD